MCAIAGVWSGGGTSDLQGLVGCMADAIAARTDEAFGMTLKTRWRWGIGGWRSSICLRAVSSR